MAAKKKKPKGDAPSERMLSIATHPIFKKWEAALKNFERTIEKRSRGEVEQPKVWKAYDKASDAYNWLRALPFEPAELEHEHERLSRVHARKEEAEAGAAAYREANRRAELAALNELEDSDPHVRYVPGIGYVQGRRVVSR